MSVPHHLPAQLAPLDISGMGQLVPPPLHVPGQPGPTHQPTCVNLVLLIVPPVQVGQLVHFAPPVTSGTVAPAPQHVLQEHSLIQEIVVVTFASIIANPVLQQLHVLYASLPISGLALPVVTPVQAEQFPMLPLELVMFVWQIVNPALFLANVLSVQVIIIGMESLVLLHVISANGNTDQPEPVRILPHIPSQAHPQSLLVMS